MERRGLSGLTLLLSHACSCLREEGLLVLAIAGLLLHILPARIIQISFSLSSGFLFNLLLRLLFVY